MNLFALVLTFVYATEPTFQQRLNNSLEQAYFSLGNIGERAASYLSTARNFFRRKMSNIIGNEETDLTLKDEKMKEIDVDNLQKALQDLIKKMENVKDFADISKMKDISLETDAFDDSEFNDEKEKTEEKEKIL